MALWEIAIPSDTAFFSKRAELDGVSYLLDFQYNERTDAWFLTLKDQDGNKIVGNLKIVTNWPLLRTHRYLSALPPGELVAIDTTNRVAAPGFRDLGTSITLTYVEASEL